MGRQSLCDLPLCVSPHKIKFSLLDALDCVAIVWAQRQVDEIIERFDGNTANMVLEPG